MGADLHPHKAEPNQLDFTAVTSSRVVDQDLQSHMGVSRNPLLVSANEEGT